jgi:hypothetical protein
MGWGLWNTKRAVLDLILGLRQSGQPGAEMPKIYFDFNPKMFKMIPTLRKNVQKYLKPRSNSSKIILKS